MKKNYAAFLRYSILSFFIIAIDQITKWYALTLPAQGITLIPGVSLVLTYNKGISWGMFHDAAYCNIVSTILAIAIALILLLLLTYSVHRYTNGYIIIPEILVFAGALSNFIDRIVHGAVIDFILLSWRDYMFPYFNVADICIVVGVITMMIYTLFFERNS